MVAAQQQQPDLRLDDFARIVGLVGGQHQRLDGGVQRNVQQLGHVGAGAFAGRRGLGEGLGGGAAWARGRQGLGLFHVGGVVAAGAVDDGVFAGGGDDLELLAQVAADGAAVGGHGTVGQAEAVEDAAVGLGHDLVARLGSSLVAVEAVGVLHGELAPPHQAEAGTALVTELRLDLVEILWQLFVAAQLLASDVSDHFFAGRLDDEVAAMAVLDAQEFRAHFLEAPCLLPELGGLHHGHGELHGAGTVHFLAHDGLDLAHHAQAHGHVVVDAGAQLLDQAGPRHELVADHLGVRRRFLEGGNKELGGFHRLRQRASGCSPLAALKAPCIMDTV